MRILVEVLDATSVEGGRPTFYAVNDVSFIEQEFRKISTILASSASNQCHALCHGRPVPQPARSTSFASAATVNALGLYQYVTKKEAYGLGKITAAVRPARHRRSQRTRRNRKTQRTPRTSPPSCRRSTASRTRIDHRAGPHTHGRTDPPRRLPSDSDNMLKIQ